MLRARGAIPTPTAFRDSTGSAAEAGLAVSAGSDSPQRTEWYEMRSGSYTTLSQMVVEAWNMSGKPDEQGKR
ncbi:MAG TPA: hypothetical protein VK797_18570 [Tepidisphaeraceae bacterium]|nr:hypothetical protein [Tepidisphaeraceae bacterium]